MTDRLSEPVDAPPLPLRPLFCTGSDLKPALRAVLRNDDRHLRSLATTTVEGRQLQLGAGHPENGLSRRAVPSAQPPHR